MTDVFISYSRKDIAFARLLHEALLENDLKTWIDWQDIPPSADWLAEVYEAIEGADAFVFIISETSLASEVCGLEIAHAAEHNKRLIPIVIHDVEAEQVPKDLSVLNWIFFDDAGEKFAEAMDDLVTAITVDQAWVKGHTRFQNRALDWDRKDRDRGLLLRGADLSEAESWLAGAAGKDPQPTALQTEFILKSREDATRRQRMTLIGVGAGLVIAVGLGILAWTQRNVAVAEGQARATAQAEAEEQRNNAFEQEQIAVEQRNVAEARQLAALSQAYLDTDLDLAILLSIEGHKRVPNYLTRGSLLSVLQKDPDTLRQFRLNQSFPDLEFHPEGDYFAASSLINILFWDPVKNIQKYEPILGHTALIHDIAINNEGSILVSGSEDGTLKLWDLENDRELIATLLENDNLSSPVHVAFSPDDSILAAATENGKVWVWDTETLEVVSKNASPLILDGGLTLSSALFINNNNQIILYTSERVEIWDYQSGEQISQLAEDGIDNIDFDSDLEKLVGFDWDEPRIHIWDSETGEQIKNIGMSSSENDYSQTKIKFQPNGELMFLINDDVIKYFNWRNPEKIYTYKDVNKYKLLRSAQYSGNPWATPALEFNPDGRSFLYGGVDGIVYLNSLFGEDHENDPFYGFVGAGTGLSLSADGTTLAATGLNENNHPVINLWSFPDLNFSGEIELGQDDTQLRTLLDYQTQFLPDGRLLFSGIDNEISIYDRDTLSKVSEQFQTIDNVKIFALSPDGKYLAAGNSSTNKDELQIWNIEEGELLGELVLSKENKLEGMAFNCAAFSPVENTLAACVDDGFITFWNLETFELIEGPIVSLGSNFDSLEYSHDGKILASSGNASVSLWDTETRFPIGVPMTKSSVHINKLLFSQDDSVIITGNDDGEISLWDVQTQQSIGIPITDLNARQLAASLPDFDNIYGLNGHSQQIVNMVLSSDDRYLITMDEQGTLHIWDFDIDSWYEKACLKAGRNLTANEWKLYFPDEVYRTTCPQFDDSSEQSEMDLSAYTTRIRDIDNMVQVFVEEGDFEFGNRDWTADNQPFRILALESFWIDQTEITNSQYELCVDSGDCTLPANNSSETRISNYYGSEAFADYPVVFVSISQAEEYCKWAGGRVPLETEWEKAARGTAGDNYPWGNSPPVSNLANFHFLTNDTTKVGSYPAGASPYGALDMAGNVNEWTYDVDTSEEEPETLDPGVFKGGAFNNSYVYTWMHTGAFAEYYANNLGFRCVSDD